MLLDFFKNIVMMLFYILDLYIVLYTIYFFITGLFAFKKKNTIRIYKPKHKLAVLIPARNEEKVIKNLIKSLKKQNYPKELYDIFVIPNNCTDNTEKVSLELGVYVIKCEIEIKTKGDVLKETFKYMNEFYSEYDAYCIFDADNIVHNNFLNRMNDTLCSGYKVAQGFRDSKNPSDSWISSSYSLFYLTQNYFFNRARMNLGWSSSINGTGFMISKELINEIGFNTVTITEDIEFAGICAANNVKIAFVDDAKTYDEQPVTFVKSWKQRMRWSMGTLDCMNKYSKDLFVTGIKKKIPQAFDMSLFYIAPIIQIFTIFVFILYIIINMLDIQVVNIVKNVIDNRGIYIIFGYVTCVLLSLLVLKLQKKSIRKSLKGVFTLAIFMITWIPINFICLFKKEQKWEQIEHECTLEIEHITEK
ncbi:MAG: glycosyltransferase family 2 protein [Clostridia bacterium]